MPWACPMTAASPASSASPWTHPPHPPGRQEDHRSPRRHGAARERHRQPGHRRAGEDRQRGCGGGHLRQDDPDRGGRLHRRRAHGRHPVRRGGQLHGHPAPQRAVRLLPGRRPGRGLPGSGGDRPQRRPERVQVRHPSGRRRRLHRHHPERQEGGLLRHLHRQGPEDGLRGRQAGHHPGGRPRRSSSTRWSTSPSPASTPCR